ncbi:hypothetical protein BDR07DRAFT_1422232 [Suillus spraguei]|nr:hypothetical protein BDR07DRAFT_1422232 [Suillus spraguei]
MVCSGQTTSGGNVVDFVMCGRAAADDDVCKLITVSQAGIKGCVKHLPWSSWLTHLSGPRVIVTSPLQPPVVSRCRTLEACLCRIDARLTDRRTTSRMHVPSHDNFSALISCNLSTTYFPRRCHLGRFHASFFDVVLPASFYHNDRAAQLSA